MLMSRDSGVSTCSLTPELKEPLGRSFSHNLSSAPDEGKVLSHRRMRCVDWHVLHHKLADGYRRRGRLMDVWVVVKVL